MDTLVAVPIPGATNEWNPGARPGERNGPSGNPNPNSHALKGRRGGG